MLGAATEEGPVVTPAARVLRRGENRFSFGVFTLAKEPIPDAEVAIYAAPRNLQGPAIGPFPARIESLETEAAFVAQTTADDPDAAKVVYIADIPLERPGEWVFGALTVQGDGYGGSLVPTPSLVGQFDPPDVGDEAPVTDTDLAADNPDLSAIDTRVPPSSMHDDNLADVLGKQPVVLLFATPQLCQSRICGPVVDVAEQVKRDSPEDVAFIHQEIYNENDLEQGIAPAGRRLRPPQRALAVRDRPRRHHHDRDRGRLQRRGAAGRGGRGLHPEWLTRSCSRCWPRRPSAGCRP